MALVQSGRLSPARRPVRGVRRHLWRGALDGSGTALADGPRPQRRSHPGLAGVTCALCEQGVFSVLSKTRLGGIIDRQARRDHRGKLRGGLIFVRYVQKNAQLLESMQEIVTADTKIFDTVSNLAADNIDSLRENMKNISSTIASLGLTQTKLVQSANKFSNPLVGAAFSPIEFDKNLDPKYQKLADDLELWNGLAKLDKILPIGAPVEKMRITSNFGTRNDPFTGKPSKHRGIDFAGKIGTELMAVAPGRVVSAGERVGYGTTVEIDHGLGFTTLYAHLSQITVARGDWVRPGTVVGLAGSTGRSTGPHLHYEIRYKGVPFDPVKFVKE